MVWNNKKRNRKIMNKMIKIQIVIKNKLLNLLKGQYTMSKTMLMMKLKNLNFETMTIMKQLMYNQNLLLNFSNTGEKSFNALLRNAN